MVLRLRKDCRITIVLYGVFILMWFLNLPLVPRNNESSIVFSFGPIDLKVF